MTDIPHYRLRFIQPHYRAPLCAISKRNPYVRYLAERTALNYDARQRGSAPDEWFWADLELVRMGLAVELC